MATNDARMAHLPGVVMALASLFKQGTAADSLQWLEAGGMPAGRVLDVVQMQADPQTRAREMPTEEHNKSLSHA